MLEYKGEYGTAKVMLDSIEQNVISQLYSFLNHEAFTNPIAIMPDCHQGKGSVVGFTMEMVNNMIIPNVIGVDINCGVYSINLSQNLFKDLSESKIDKRIREVVPFGTNVHTTPITIDPVFWNLITSKHRDFVLKFNKKFNENYSPKKFDQRWFINKCDEIGMDYGRAIQSIGTLGGGNHFIEIGESGADKSIWITVHSGSRQFGLKICNYWQKKAGKGELAYLSGNDMFGYLSDMVAAQLYADLNRFTMIENITKVCNIPNIKLFIHTKHNFIDFNDFIIRKGAIRSYIGQSMLIPLNMEDGILICRGKSNPEWNFSAPHGAGRLGSRKWAKETLDLQTAEQSMKDHNIYASKIPKDEIKTAYKSKEIIEEAIVPTAFIVDIIKPIIAMKD